MTGQDLSSLQFGFAKRCPCKDLVHPALYLNSQLKQGIYIRRPTFFIFSFRIGLVTQLNGSAM